MAATAAVVAIAALSLVVAPKHPRKPGPMPSTAIIAVDTSALQVAVEQSRARLTSADSGLTPFGVKLWPLPLALSLAMSTRP